MENGVAQKVNSQKGGAKILVIILVILVIVAGVLLAMRIWQDSQNTQTTGNAGEENIQNQEVEEPQPKTFAGNSRPIAFMIDNNINAMPQAGLEQADLVYEIIVEGGETRLMALMKDKELDRIGPLRSARHYFLDYALENDAIYVHYGQSPQAKSDITTLGIADINGIYESGSYFWRDSSRYAPHNAVTSSEQIQKIIEREDYRTTTNKGTVLNYVVEEVELEGEENDAYVVTIPYSVYNTVRYEYNEETKTYTRYSRDEEQLDWNTNKSVQVKNIIITKCENSSDGSSTGRQVIDNIGKLDGYYITNGKYIPITCEKTERSEKTVYKDLEGNEIEVNDGKTFIQICPIDSDIEFEGASEE